MFCGRAPWEKENHNSDRRGPGAGECRLSQPSITRRMGNRVVCKHKLWECLVSGKYVSLSWALALFGSPGPSMLHIFPLEANILSGHFYQQRSQNCVLPSSLNLLFLFSHQDEEGANSEANICLLKRRLLSQLVVIAKSYVVPGQELCKFKRIELVIPDKHLIKCWM